MRASVIMSGTWTIASDARLSVFILTLSNHPPFQKHFNYTEGLGLVKETLHAIVTERYSIL